jgi:hypothetical protein
VTPDGRQVSKEILSDVAPQVPEVSLTDELKGIANKVNNQRYLKCS